MDGLLRRLIGGVVGVVLMLGLWSLKAWFSGDDASGSHAPSSAGIPAKLWEGGGPTLTITAETSGKARLHVGFESASSIEDANHRYLEASQALEPGKHVITVEMPKGIGGSVDLMLEAPPVGATAKLSVTSDGQTIGEDSATLDAPLKPGYAFGVIVDRDDFSPQSVAESDEP